jgi:hypothetical protein
MTGGRMSYRRFGRYRGIVANVDDIEKKGRLIAKVPEVYGDQDSPWAKPCVPSLDIIDNIQSIPPIGDGVWIEFEEGDIEHPIWTGGWFTNPPISSVDKDGKFSTLRRRID